MSSFYPTFLYFSDDAGYMTELFNGARTARNLLASGLGQFSNIDQFAGCRALAYQPLTITVTPPSTITCQQWDPIVYTQATQPWYADTGVAYPGTAYGFYITDITGLDGELNNRSTTQLGVGRGGAYFGPSRAKARVCKVNVQLVGATEIDLEHLFRWMELQLTACCGGGGCGGGGNVVFRRYCPDLTGYDTGSLGNEALTFGVLTAGLTMARDGVLLEGPTWEALPLENGGCWVRSASFTLGFADPCLYVVDDSSPTTTFTDLTAGTFTARRDALYPEDDAVLPNQAIPGAWSTLAAFPAHPLTVVRTRSDYIGTAGAIITISSPTELNAGTIKKLPDLRIVTYLPISNNSSTDPTLAHRLSEIVLAGIDSGQIVEVDLHRQRVRERGSRDSDDWNDASKYLRRVSGVSRWAGSNCNGGFLRVEPLSVDQTKTLANSSLIVSNYTVSVQPGTHFGCSC